MPKHKETMSNVDTAWLQMDRPTNLMMIASFMTFDEPLDYERLLATVERRLLIFERFRQRVVPPRIPFGNYTWEDDPHFDIRAHVHRAALPAPGDKAALQAMMSDIISTPLDRSRPLWHYYLLDGYRGGSVVACRLHHSIADGIALMRVLLSMTDLTPDAPLPSDPVTEADPEKERGLLSALVSPATSLARTTLRTTGSVADFALHQSMETLRDPWRLVDVAKIGAGGAARLAKMALRTPDPHSLFKGELGIRKATAWTDAFPLSDVKAIAKALDGTINDTMMTVVAGALRRYLIDHNASVDGLTVRATVPVNLRPLDEPLELGNHFGLVFPTLPIGSADIHERFIETRRYMKEIKESPEAVVAYSVLQALGMTPSDIESVFLNFFASKSSMVLTNVPGPQVQLYLAGRPLREIMAWVPQSGGLGMGISIISYNGGVMVGVTTDVGLVAHPEEIINNVYIEFEALRQLAAEARARADEQGISN